MKAIILAAGRGTRLKPITNTTPKPMIKIMGKPIIEHNIESIYKEVSEIIIVVKYLKEQFIEYFGNDYKGTSITYFEQGEEKGTAAALRGIESNRDILLMYGDSIFEKNDLSSIIELNGYGCLTQEVSLPENYGIFSQDKSGNAIEIIEKPQKYVGNLASIGVFKFSHNILDLSNKVEVSERNEYELTDAINSFCKKNTFQLITMKGKFIDIGYPWHILEANSYFLQKLKQSEIHGTIEDGVTIKGNIILEQGAILKSGTYIEGNCYIGNDSKIGPNCYIRGETVIGINSHIGNAVEVKNSSIGDNSNAGHLSYIGDSIIGNNVNLGAGFITANLRHDGKNMRCIVNEKLVTTGRRKLGVIIGSNSKIGIKSMAYPGRVLENNSIILPGTTIK